MSKNNKVKKDYKRISFYIKEDKLDNLEILKNIENLKQKNFSKVMNEIIEYYIENIKNKK